MVRKDISNFQVVAAYAAKGVDNWDGVWPYEAIAKATGQPEKVCYAACERAYRDGLIEYGVSLRAGWLTEKGLALLKEGQ